MLSPYFGPSIVIHLGVILILRVLMVLPFFKHRSKKLRQKEHLIVNSIIMALTITLVYLSAAPLLYLSITGERSSIHMISSMIETWQESHEPEVNIDIPPSPAPVMALDASQQSCIDVSSYVEEYGSSVVNYLTEQDQNFAFSARERLAAEYGIDGYRGSEEQNVRLLINLLLEDIGVESFDSCNDIG